MAEPKHPAKGARCKPGDLVVFLPGHKLPDELVGTVGTVLRRAETGPIELGGETLIASSELRWWLRAGGHRAVWCDSALQPIRGDAPAKTRRRARKQQESA